MDNQFSLSQLEIQRLLDHDLTYIPKNMVPLSLCAQCSSVRVPILCCARCALLRVEQRHAQIRAERRKIERRKAKNRKA